MKPDTQKAWQHLIAAKEVVRILNKGGYDGYVIGGAVRDIIFGDVPKDFDIVTNATPEEISNLKEIKKSKFKDTSQAFGVTRASVPVITNGETATCEIEIATYRRDIEAHLGRKLTKVEFSTLNDDVKRRDLTINALAYNPLTNELVDLVDGLKDIDSKTIRFIGDPLSRIQEDPMRILRAVRLKNQLGFRFSKQTEQDLMRAVKQGYVKHIASDRVKTELTKMLKHRNRIAAIADLDYLGLLKELMPELLKMKGTPQPPEFHMEGDVWEHTLLALQHLPDKVSSRTVWGTLLHDIGKPYTIQSAEETGDRIRFNQHYIVGAKIAKGILKRLRFSNKFIADVFWMIDNHMSIDSLPDMKPSKQKVFLSHDAFLDLFEMHKADAYAAWNKLDDNVIEVAEPKFTRLENLWRGYKEQTHRSSLNLKQDLGINGDWLIKEFGLKPGGELGTILQKLNDAYIDGEIIDEAECRQFVKRLLS